MRSRILSIAGIVALTAVALAAQSTMNQVRLAEGETDINRLTAPILDPAAMAPLGIGAFSSAYDKKLLFVRRGGGNMFTRGPEYKLNATVDIAAIFAESLATQGRAMGLRMAGAGGDAGWKLSGTIRDLYLESRQIPYGATLFYGYLDTQIQLTGPAGASHTATVRLHNFCGGYNAGMGRRDEAESCAAQLLIEGAQELLARLNRDYFKAAPQAAIAQQLAALNAASVDKQRAAVRAIGLSGLQTATPALLTLLPTVTAESGRAAIIDALAVLGSSSAVSLLSTRYTLEDEDPRWSTLKAMDYIGGDEATKVISSVGMSDKDLGPKRLAQRILKK
jgi:hypothetical protein